MPPKILIIGIGNPGRRDDGLGAALSARLEGLNLPGVACRADYQLGPEDALDCSEADIVIFADAARDLAVPFELREVGPALSYSVTTHDLPPETVLALCAELYGRRPRAYLLAIQGTRWDLRESLTAAAEQNLRLAVNFLTDFIKQASEPSGEP